MSRRLALVIHALAGGGAERVLAGLANHWAQQGDHVTLITLAAPQADDYATHEQVQRVGLDALRDSAGMAAALWNNATRLRKLRREIRRARPDCVVSFTTQMNVLALLATVGLRAGVMISERVDPRHHQVGARWAALRRWTYRRCRAAVVQTAGVRDFMQRLVGDRPVYVIPNAAPEVADVATAARRDEEDRGLVLAVGRLCAQKGFDLLIRTFAEIADKHPHWRLRILGEGPDRASLAELIERHHLGGRVELAGWSAAPEKQLAAADLFVLSSRYEGFPNALLEAMASGLPAVAFDCESGPAEIIRHETDGWLVPAADTHALAAALDRLMGDAPLRRRLGQAARDVTQRFSRELFWQRWQAALDGADPDSALFSS